MGEFVFYTLKRIEKILNDIDKRLNSLENSFEKKIKENESIKVRK